MSNIQAEKRSMVIEKIMPKVRYSVFLSKMKLIRVRKPAIEIIIVEGKYFRSIVVGDFYSISVIIGFTERSKNYFVPEELKMQIFV
jgi:hypothetical protein